MTHRVALALLLIATELECKVEVTKMPKEFQTCFDEYSRRTDLRGIVGELVNWDCRMRYTWKLAMRQNLHPNDADLKWFQDLMNSLNVTKPCGTKVPLRKEIRMLSGKERRRFARAVNKLKAKKYGSTNRYDYLASLHTGIYIPIGHFGPNFLPWHRLHLILFEKALQEIDPDVVIPYWDTSIDAEMKDPKESIIWTDLFVGNGNGQVITGPYANWTTPDGPLHRNVGKIGGLITKKIIAKFLSKKHLGEISHPNSEGEYNIEINHGGTLLFVGGQMEKINSAAYDPVYLLFHSFIDYIFDMFQKRTENSEKDWPKNYGTLLHAPGASSGFGVIPSQQGLSRFYTSCVYRYQPSPECAMNSLSCGSNHLNCRQKNYRYTCISKSKGEMKNYDMCPKSRFSGVQNGFCLNGRCDISEWVFLPIEVYRYRPPGIHIKHSLPVRNNLIDGNHDIYEILNNTNLKLPPDALDLAKFQKCKKYSLNDVFVETTGINYDGFYKEVVLTDKRMPISIAHAYIAVKNPEIAGPAKFRISASDSCGRVCKIFTKARGVGYQFYQQSSGALEISKQLPKMYGRSIEESVAESWSFARGCPKFISHDIFIRVLCDYKENWIWSESVIASNNAHDYKFFYW